MPGDELDRDQDEKSSPKTSPKPDPGPKKDEKPLEGKPVRRFG